MSLVSIRDVRKSFGSLEVLKGVSLEVKKGDVVAIIGRSGSGKSTLLRCINGLETYQSGAILADGIEVGGDKTQPARTAPPCRHGVPAVQSVSASDRGRKRHAGADGGQQGAKKGSARYAPPRCWPRSACRRRCDAYPSQLSGGQQQRVAIARSLAMRPKVLLCDEITSALDPELVNEVLRVVEQLANEGMTLMLVTHEMRFARDVGTDLVFMHHGKVHEQGPPKEVFAAPKTPELQQFVSGIG